MESKKNNIAFVDGQNLYLGTVNAKKSWRVNLKKFRIYLSKKYNVNKAYYYLGCVNNEYQSLYDEIQESGFILKFREHNTAMKGMKKGNVDTDIVFDIMKKIYKKDNFDKIVLVSGDGDFKALVDFLIKEEKFEKILFPNKKFASSLYKNITHTYFDYIENSKKKFTQ